MDLEKRSPDPMLPATGNGGGVSESFFRKLSVFHSLPAELIASVQAMQHRNGSMAQGADIVHAGQPYDGVYILNQGWAVRYRILPDGNRQIANFILPGDFMCLNACIFPRADFTITTLTPIRYSHFRTEEIVRLTEMHPLMCAALFWCNAREESILVEHLASIGRRSAYSRVAHLVLELWRRLTLIGLVENGSSQLEGTFELPLTQQLIADALGLSSIHVNRTLRALESDGFIVCERREGVRRLWLRNVGGLTNAAGFDDEFLHFTEIPRRVGVLLEEAERRRKPR